MLRRLLFIGAALAWVSGFALSVDKANAQNAQSLPVLGA